MSAQFAAEEGSRYRAALVRTLQEGAQRFPAEAPELVLGLLEHLALADESSAPELLALVRHTLHSHPAHRPTLLSRLLAALEGVKGSRVWRGALWVLGEFAEAPDELRSVLAALKTLTGGPRLQAPAGAAPVAAPVPSAPSTGQANKVLADGTYATSSALETTSNTSKTASVPSVSGLHEALMGGDGFLAAVLGATLTKLALKVLQVPALQGGAAQRVQATVLLYLTSLLKATPAADRDCSERLVSCLKLLAGSPSPSEVQAFLAASRPAFEATLLAAAPVGPTSSATRVPIDSFPTVRLLVERARGKYAEGLSAEDEDWALGIAPAAFLSPSPSAAINGSSSSASISTVALVQTVQLTGYSDPVYAEAEVRVQPYSIELEVRVKNQTADTLQQARPPFLLTLLLLLSPLSQVSLELAALGDLKVIERAPPASLAPYAERTVRAALRVASTEHGAIFPSLVYETAGREVVVPLRELHVDVLAWLRGEPVEEAAFRKMWLQFEWENKLAVHAPAHVSPQRFLARLEAATHLKSLTPPSALQGPLAFLSFPSQPLR